MGGKSQRAPDYSELAASSREAVALGRELGTRQLDFAERQYNEMAPIAQEIAGLQMDAQRQQMEQAGDYYDYMQETFRPLERGLVADAEAFSSESYRQRMSSEAAAAASRAFANTQSQLDRADRARGLNPNSPAARAARQQASVGLAAQRANAMTSAGDRAEQMGWARRLDAAGLGRGLAGASTAAYGGATGAGTSAMGVAQAPGAAYMAGMGQGSGTMMTGLQTGIDGFGRIASTQGSIYSNGINAQSEMLGTAVGLGIGMSDRRTKENIVFRYVDSNTGLNIYDFNYKGQPDRRFRGVMADEVETICPEAVGYDDLGFASVDYGMIGITFMELTEAA